MDRKFIYAVIVGVVLFAVGVSLRLFANQEGLQVILFFITAFVIGVVATGVKRGFLLSFVLSLIYGIVNTAIFMPEAFTAVSDINVALAFVVLLLINAAIAGAIGAVGGFLGKRIFK